MFQVHASIIPYPSYILTLYATGLANITFAWMVEQCRPYLAFDENMNATLATYLQRVVEDHAEQSSRAEIAKAMEALTPGMVGATAAAITGNLNATKNWLGSFIRTPSDENAAPKEKMVRTYCFSISEDPKVPEVKPHSWALFRNQDSYSRMYKFISHLENRTPGVFKDQSAEHHTPLHKLGDTCEWMHPSVWWRQDKSQKQSDEELKYKSEALAAYDYTPKNGLCGWQRKKNKKDKQDREVWIPEWPIEAALDEDEKSSSENAELALIDACEDKEAVRTFLKENAIAWNKANRPAVGELHAAIYT